MWFFPVLINLSLSWHSKSFRPYHLLRPEISCPIPSYIYVAFGATPVSDGIICVCIKVYPVFTHLWDNCQHDWWSEAGALTLPEGWFCILTLSAVRHHLMRFVLSVFSMDLILPWMFYQAGMWITYKGKKSDLWPNLKQKTKSWYSKNIGFNAASKAQRWP